MGSQVMCQIVQFSGRPFPNERGMDKFQCFPITQKMNQDQLKEYIQYNYGYCKCRLNIHEKESSEIAKKYDSNNIKGVSLLYVSVNPDLNCRCSYFYAQKMNEEIKKNFTKLENENKDLKKIIEKQNKEISKIKSTVDKLESHIIWLKNEFVKRDGDNFKKLDTILQKVNTQ